MISLLLTLATMGQDSDPLARNAKFMKSAQGLTLEFTVKEPNVATPGQAKLVMRFPDMQSFSCKWEKESFRYVHSKAGALAIRDDWREYEEGQAYPRNVQPSGEISGLSELAYPNFLLYPSLQDFDRNAKREVQGKEDVRGATCDKLYVVSEARGTAGRHTFWVDSEGKVLRWRRILDTQTGTVDTTTEFTKIEKSAPSDPAFYASKLPVGYMPTSIPEPNGRPHMVSAPAVFGTWTDARRDTKVDAAKLLKGSAVAMVFTDPECAICATIEPYLVSLRKSLKAKGCALVEVSLGKRKPDVGRKDKDRQVFWDKDGTIELAYGTPGTPYFLLADKDGVLVRGWQGYAKSMEADITKNLLSAFDKKG